VAGFADVVENDLHPASAIFLGIRDQRPHAAGDPFPFDGPVGSDGKTICWGSEFGKIKELSKGMRAQAGLVVAVAHRPDLLILDEPSSGLDAVVRADILQAIVRTISDEGKTVVFSSHLLEEVERLSDHVTMIHQGRVVLNGTLESVKELHLRSQIRFPQVLDALPPLEGVLAKDGSGRAWTLTHSAETSVADKLSAAIAAMGGEVIQSREATLEEIFIARVGRVADKHANETQKRQAA
jgi:ABC-2 type transport system ATP-binding protein